MYKFELLKSAIAEISVTKIFLELPKSCQVSLDKFFSGKIDKITELKRYQNSKDILNFLLLIRNKFQLELKEGKIKVQCADISWFNSPIRALNTFLTDFPKLESLDKILKQHKEKPKRNLDLFKEIQADIKKNINNYQNCFGIYFELFTLMIDENEVYYSIKNPLFSYDFEMYRESRLKQFILSNIDITQEKGMFFTGMLHLIDKNQESFSDIDGRVIPSVYERMNNDVEFNILRIIIIYLPFESHKGKLQWYPEKMIDKNFWFNHIKGQEYCIVQSKNVSGFDQDLCDLLFIVNLKMFPNKTLKGR